MKLFSKDKRYNVKHTVHVYFESSMCQNQQNSGGLNGINSDTYHASTKFWIKYDHLWVLSRPKDYSKISPNSVSKIVKWSLEETEL